MRKTLVVLLILMGLALAAGRSRAEDFRLRVMTLNCGSGSFMDLTPEGIGRIADIVLDNRADIVGLQEIDIGSDWYGGRDHVAELQVLLAERGYPMFPFVTKNVPYFNGYQVHALLSRWPIIDSENTWIDPFPGWNLDRITVEPVPGLSLDFWNCHFPVDKTGKDDLVRQCFEHVAARPNPAVYMGDFNFGTESPLMDIARAAGFRHTCVDDTGAPCYSVSIAGAGVVDPLPLTGQIDHFFVKGEVRTVRNYAHYFSTSDHWPVIVDLAYDAPEGTPDLGDNVRVPAPERPWDEAADLWRQQRLPEAAKAYEALANFEEGKNTGYYLYSAATIRLLNGEKDKAFELYQRLVKAYPKSYWGGWGWQRLSFLYEERGNFRFAHMAAKEHADLYYKIIRPWVQGNQINYLLKRLSDYAAKVGWRTDRVDILNDLAAQYGTEGLGRAAHYQLSLLYLGKEPRKWFENYMWADPDPMHFTNNKERMREIAYALCEFGEYEKADFLIYERDIGTGGGNPIYGRNVLGGYWPHRYPKDYDIHVGVGKPYEKTLEGDRYVFRYLDAPNDLHGELRIDATPWNLTIQVIVEDATHVNNNSPDLMWMGDSMQVAIDPGLEGGGVYDANDSEFGIALSSDGENLFYAWKTGEGSKLDAEHIERGVTRDGNTTTYTLLIPIDALGLPDPNKKQFGINLVVNDNDGLLDGNKRTAVIEWAPGIASQKAPDMYPKVTVE